MAVTRVHSNLVFSPDQTTEVETPGIHGDALLGHPAHDQHEVVAGALAARGRVHVGQQGGGVLVAGDGEGAAVQRARQHLGPLLLRHGISETHPGSWGQGPRSTKEQHSLKHLT